MSAIRLKSIQTSGDVFDNKAEVVINVSGSLDRNSVLEQDLTLTKDDYGKWHATIALDEFPKKDSPEEAVERLSLWLKVLSKALNKSQVKKLKLGGILKTINF